MLDPLGQAYGLMPFFQLPFDVTINLGFLQEWAKLPLHLLFWEIFRNGGWVVFLIVLLKGFGAIWLHHRQQMHGAKQKNIFLAIDIPKDNIQTPKAVENIFTALAGAHGTETWWDKWWHGKFQKSFSVEVISIDGYVQFVVRTNEAFRDLVESAIFAQYPNAEIAEIDDYTKNVPRHFPDLEWDMWGSEYKLHQPEVYPIKTWEEFEHGMAEEGTFKDPMAGMLEILSAMRVGEQVWIQVLVLPIDDHWKEAGEELVKELIGVPKEEHGLGWIGTIILWPISLISDILTSFISSEPAPEEHKREEPPSRIQYMSPGAVDVVKGIQKKISKLGFKCKIRLIYVARKEVYSKSRGASGPVGAIKQFNTLNLNSFRPDKKTWTNVYYWFINYRRARRQNDLMRGYRSRDLTRGGGLFVLNIEELASIWHFPVKEVKAPLLRKTEGKKGEPPTGLPIERSIPLEIPVAVPEAPIELPVEALAADTKPAERLAKSPAAGEAAPLPAEGQRAKLESEPPSNLPIG